MEDYSDPIVMNAELLLQRAEGAMASGDAYLKYSIGEELRTFAANNGAYLKRTGNEWLIDQLDAGWGNLTGNQAGTAENPNRYTTSAAQKQSAVWAGAKAGVQNAWQRLGYWFGGKKPDGDPPGDDIVKKLMKYAAIAAVGYVTVQVMKTVRAFKS